MMFDVIILYDSNHDETTRIAQNRAPEIGAKAIGVSEVLDLKVKLTELKKSGVRISRLLFYTHGDPGSISFGSSFLVSSRVLTEFVGNGFEDLFLPDAQISFDGCNVAEVKQGCEVGQNCSQSDNGPIFLTSVAKTFLFKGGGHVVGWTSAGFGFPSLGGSVIHHWTGTAVHIFITKGGLRTRLAVGRTEWPSPLGRWEVQIDKETFYYRFDSPNQITWTDHKKNAAGDSTPMGKGTWKMDSGGVKIAWESRETETWDVPLYDEYQTGTAMDVMGFDLGVIARMV